MKPGRYNTNGILKRLETKGFIHESDLVWLERRERKLIMALKDAEDNEKDAEHAKVIAALEGLFVPCTGEAHDNAFIDNCMVCAPRWGRVINRDKVLRKLPGDQVELLGVLASANGLAMPLRSAEVDVAEKLQRYGFVEVDYRPRCAAIITDKGREHLARLGDKQS